jgi:hypothetical protein
MKSAEKFNSNQAFLARIILATRSAYRHYCKVHSRFQQLQASLNLSTELYVILQQSSLQASTCPNFAAPTQRLTHVSYVHHLYCAPFIWMHVYVHVVVYDTDDTVCLLHMLHNHRVLVCKTETSAVQCTMLDRKRKSTASAYRMLPKRWLLWSKQQVFADRVHAGFQRCTQTASIMWQTTAPPEVINDLGRFLIRYVYFGTRSGTLNGRSKDRKLEITGKEEKHHTACTRFI